MSTVLDFDNAWSLDRNSNMAMAQAPLRNQRDARSTPCSQSAITVNKDGKDEGCLRTTARSRSIMSVQTDSSKRTTISKPKARPRTSSLKASTTAALALFAVSLPGAMAQSCISLSGSKTCPAFNASSISTNTNLTSQFPFLSFVSNLKDFDNRLASYVSSDYVKLKYQNLLQCGNINLSNTSDLYARYATSVLCNAIVQNSKAPCSLSDADSRPLCADSCAQNAIGEQQIVSMSELCSNPGRNAVDLIRADFTVCALPSNSLSGNCISASTNEVDNCGYSTNLIGLCSYCAKSSPNATDTCCYHSNVTRCNEINIPAASALPPLFPTTSSTASPTSSASASASAVAGKQGSSSGGGLSGGQIAGIVVGSVVGALLIAALLVALCVILRRRRGSQSGSMLNQPTPARKKDSQMVYNPLNGSGAAQQGYEVLPGGRIARMSALEGTSGYGPHGNGRAAAGGAAAGGAAGALAGGIAGTRRRHAENSSSDGYGESPESKTGPLRAPPAARHGSLSSGSALGAAEESGSPNQSGSGGEFSSPMGMASQQSEQLPFFKDYYSNDDIHPGDKVSVLWAYQPRAGDEFELERGDMLKVVGIWDDGWATGVRLTERAEDWDAKKKAQRDSGLSNGSEKQRRTSSPPPAGEIKAFPLVCVCLPDHWKKTIEGDGSTETTSSAPQATSP